MKLQDVIYLRRVDWGLSRWGDAALRQEYRIDHLTKHGLDTASGDYMIKMRFKTKHLSSYGITLSSMGITP